MSDKWRFLLNRIGERLWVKPLVFCVISIAAVLLAKLADLVDVGDFIVEVSPGSVESLLRIMSASMLVIATFAVGSMVAAYSSASSTATPRSFPLIISDDVSQNALSTFVGAFIFSIVALIAFQNGFYETAGRFVVFTLTLAVFGIVIVTFVRWVDNIARLGRLGSTVRKVEASARDALQKRRQSPYLGGIPTSELKGVEQPVFSEVVGYVQRVDMAMLQLAAEQAGMRVTLSALPGAFAAPGRELAFITADIGQPLEFDSSAIREAFVVGTERTFDEDPRFGLIVLSEIACRALSPAVNDPGTAIDVIGSLVRLFSDWCTPAGQSKGAPDPEYPLIQVPELSLDDMLEDAFRGIARDGAGTIEVAVRLQKAFEALTAIGDDHVHGVAMRHARLASARAEAALEAPDDLRLLRSTAQFASAPR